MKTKHGFNFDAADCISQEEAKRYLATAEKHVGKRPQQEANDILEDMISVLKQLIVLYDQTFVLTDELLEDYKDAVLKAYSWREYSGVYYLHKSQLEHAAKRAIFDYFEKENNEN